jgi:hypothetical protein
MTEIKKMYHILEEMVDRAIKGDKEKIKELDGSYEELVPGVYHRPLSPLDLEYDNCRQSCVMSVSMPNMRERFISDAKKRFSKIPKPKQ